VETTNTSPTIARKPVNSEPFHEPTVRAVPAELAASDAITTEPTSTAPTSAALPTKPTASTAPTTTSPTSPTTRDTAVLDPREFAHLADPTLGHKIDSLARLPSEIDISKTVDTTVQTSYAPAVTHEVVEETVHEIVTQEITREIHTHDIYHRVLPVLEFEVLPARHWVKLADGSGLRELEPSEIPGGLAVAEGLNRCIADAVRNFDPRAVVTTNPTPSNQTSSAPIIPAVFTARSFPGSDYDTRQWTDPSSGIQRSEQWWVHRPTLEVDKDWIIDGTNGERGVEMHFWHGEGNPEHAEAVNGEDRDGTALGGVDLTGLGKTKGGVVDRNGNVEREKLVDGRSGDVVAHALPATAGTNAGATGDDKLASGGQAQAGAVSGDRGRSATQEQRMNRHENGHENGHETENRTENGNGHTTTPNTTSSPNTNTNSTTTRDVEGLEPHHEAVPTAGGIPLGQGWKMREEQSGGQQQVAVGTAI
jgi:hypothetical protein